MEQIFSKTAFDPVENISYAAGEVLSVEHRTNTAKVDISGTTYTLPVIYNSADKPSYAFAKGDEVLVRKYKNEPSHVIGFTGYMWPSVLTPALGFGSQTYDHIEKSFTQHPAPFSDRYKKLTENICSVDAVNYLNDEDARTGDGFTIIQNHWTDSKYHRDTKFFYKDELIYQTYNNETFSGVFNGTRSNVFGYFIHQQSGWGCMVYQINTFYNWLPRTSGRVVFDFYIYSSSGFHSRLAHACADVNGSSVQAVGDVVSNTVCTAMNDSFHGALMKSEVNIADAGIFTSDGTTNYIAPAMDSKTFYSLTLEDGEHFFISINSKDLPAGQSGIYIKNR